MNSQKGVALVQVLLITSMLLMLMVQISKDTRRQVQTAMLLKTKANLELQIFSEREKLKFELLTARKTQNAGVDTSYSLNFRGEDVNLNKHVTVSLQDEDGLVSLVYGGESLLEILGGEEAKYQQLQAYQGADTVSVIPPGYRGGLLPGKDELIVTGMITQRDLLALVTHLPTFQFNLYNSPSSLLNKVYGQEKAQQILQLQKSGKVDYNDWRDILGGNEEVAVSKLPGNFITATFRTKQETLEITRKIRIMMNFDQIPYIAEVAVN